MSKSFRLALDWDGFEGPTSIVAKCPSLDETNTRDRASDSAATRLNLAGIASWLAMSVSLARSACMSRRRTATSIL